MLPKVAVIMSTYNGQRYLDEQIETILRQRKVDLSLFIRDDGSTDETIGILKNYQQNKRINVMLADNVGYEASFFDLCRRVPNEFDYYAFADQDDYWDEDKLKSAVEKLQKSSQKVSLYYSALRMVDQSLSNTRIRKYDQRNNNFESSMVRNDIAGCSMVFSKELFMSLKTALREFNSGLSVGGHDAFVYRLNLFLGGNSVYDNVPHFYFRRYDDNATQSGRISFKRVLSELNLRNNKDTRYQTAKILNHNSKYAPEGHRKIVEDIVNYKSSIIRKIQLVGNTKMSWTFWPVALVTKAQIIFNQY